MGNDIRKAGILVWREDEKCEAEDSAYKKCTSDVGILSCWVHETFTEKIETTCTLITITLTETISDFRMMYS